MDLLKRTATKRLIFFVIADIFFVAISVWLAFFMRFDGAIPAEYHSFMLRMIILTIIFMVPIFYFKKLYSFSWSYVSMSEIISLFIAITVSFIFLSIAIFISVHFPHFINFPRSTIFMSYLLVFIFCGALRFSKRMYLNVSQAKKFTEKEATLIVGAGDAGEQILRSIISSKINSYSPVGFVDDNPIKKGVAIHGIRVLGKIADIPEIVESHQIKQLIIALPNANNKVIQNAVFLGRSAGVRKIKIAPSIHEVIRGDVSLKNLRDVDVEDLLGRDPVQLDKKQIEQWIKGKAVLITGAAGSIGSELSRQVAKFKPSHLLLLDQDETGIFHIEREIHEKFPEVQIKSLVIDILDEKKIEAVFKEQKPEIVFHAAAYKHVPLMEAQPDQAIKNNIFGTNVLLKTSVANNVEKFIFISTDKAVNPTSVMGTTKKISEMLCQVYSQQNSTKCISVRFGNVLNSRGSVIPIFKEQIRKGGPVEVTDPEMKRYFMLTAEACLLVMQAGAMGQGGEVFVLDMGKPVKIVDLAKEMIRLSGFEVDRDIAIIYTGIRPGEKLFEEILTAEEGIVATQNEKIFIAKMSKVDAVRLLATLDELQEMIYHKDIPYIISGLKRIISGENL